jgi:DNA-binding transcriptional LysR family regulator
VLHPDDLDALDLLIWQRTGERAANLLFCHQSTISRRVRHCLQTLQLDLVRLQGEWELQGNGLLVELEREVHQLHRLLGGGPLRIEATYWAAEAFLQPLPAGWMPGVFDHVGMERPLQLLRDRVIDAWIGSYQPDLPDANDPEWVVFDLCRMPVRVMADRAHPLAQERGLAMVDLHRFPSLALPEGLFPRTEAHLRQQGLWNTPVAFTRYAPEFWEGRTADQLTLGFGNCLNHQLSPELVAIDWDLELVSGEALVVRRDVAHHGPILNCLQALQQRARRLQEQHPELELVR